MLRIIYPMLRIIVSHTPYYRIPCSVVTNRENHTIHAFQIAAVGCRLILSLTIYSHTHTPFDTHVTSLYLSSCSLVLIGRCNDLIEMGAFDTSKINYLVLDEADRMLDMGFGM